MKTYQVVKLGDVLKRNTKQIRIEDNQKYKQVTVRLWGKGVQLRNEVYGHEIKSDSRYIVKSGQFIVSKIDARNGASGLIPEELDGAIITGDFLSFDINKDLILPEYLLWLSRSEWFIEQCVQASSGTTNRIRLNESKFLQIEISLPNISEQAQIIRKIQDAVQIINNIDLVLTEQKQLTENLRQSILQKAIQGHLVEQDPNDEPAADLLKRIREEKERLIKEKKIKKEKPLPPISPEEIPYELPKGWEWVRLGEIGSWGAGATPNRNNPLFYNGSIPWLKTGELNDAFIFDSEEKITELALEKNSIRLNKPGDVLIAMYGATIGKLGILGIEAATNQACCACTPFSGIYNKYLFYYLMSRREFFQNQGAGGAQPNISKEKIINTLMPLPPTNEQKRIVDKIERLFSICEELERCISTSKHESDLLVQSVLRETFQQEILI
ncbi:restriction endonuclease subunit S [Microaerobacter geothermalis]|uniref:restriction endonuclease subunit S n=1 Tax=Microaerobacter geothermalis TaxID=674972 RepID=UPI001F488B73|nr:restriction endonuclease subunit S [Microaerobacter geothermalis]MCF6093899.1 restriction endonuclease subunit S [Microaerobacter geothermalis]